MKYLIMGSALEAHQKASQASQMESKVAELAKTEEGRRKLASTLLAEGFKVEDFSE